MTPESITGLTIPRELVQRVLAGEQPIADTRRLRVLAALADIDRRPEALASRGEGLGEAA